MSGINRELPSEMPEDEQRFDQLKDRVFNLFVERIRHKPVLDARTYLESKGINYDRFVDTLQSDLNQAQPENPSK